MHQTFEQSTRPGALGERLRRERELRGISLDEISSATKISTRLLRALEEERFELLPGGIFNKGYLRAYAKYIGIDEEWAIAEYLQILQSRTAEVEQPSPRTQSGRLSAKLAHLKWPEVPLIPALIVLVSVLGVAGGWQVYREHQRNQHNSRATGAQPVIGELAGEDALPAELLLAPGVASASTSIPASSEAQGSTAAASRSGAAEGFEVRIRTKKKAKVSIRSDGKLLVHGWLRPAEVKIIHASRRVVFWTGSPRQVELSFNGKSIPISGKRGEKVLVFDSDGLVNALANQ